MATVADVRVVFGEPTTVHAAGFAPGERVTATLHSTPRLLGVLAADETGAVRLTVTVTVDDGPGNHDVVFVGERSGTVAVRADRNRTDLARNLLKDESTWCRRPRNRHLLRPLHEAR